MSLYSNEYFDRGMNVVTDNVEEILSNVQEAKPQLQGINDSFTANISVELGRLKDEAYSIFQRHKNETVNVFIR